MKKLLCSLLAIVMLVAFCGCGLNANIKEFKISGDETTVEEFQEWMELQEILAEQKAEAGEMEKSQWYSLKAEVAMEMSNGEEYENVYTDASGKMYVSPFVYEMKAKITANAKMESATLDANDKLEKASGSSKMSMVMVNGESYTKTTSVEKDEAGKSEGINYSKSSASDDVMDDILGDLGFDITDIFESLGQEGVKIYKKGNGFAIQLEIDETEGDNSSKTLVQLIIELKKDSTELKQMCYYVLNETSMTVDGETVKTKIVTKMEIKKALFGTSVKRPGDYYKYENYGIIG